METVPGLIGVSIRMELRAKVQELNKKHRDWKAQHAAQQVDPDQDALYRELVNTRRPYAAAIPGLVCE